MLVSSGVNSINVLWVLFIYRIDPSTIFLWFFSPSALHTILQVLDRNNVFLGKRFQEIYQNLQAAQELDELNDSNSFLTLAINSAVKTLEHSEVGIFLSIIWRKEN